MEAILIIAMLLLFGGTVFVGLGILLFTLLTGFRLKSIHQYERLVIFRHRQFHRIIGPGWGRMWCFVDKVERTINTKEQTQRFVIPAFVSDMKITYVLDLRYRVDPMAALGRDHKKLEYALEYDLLELQTQIDRRLTALLPEMIMNDQLGNRGPVRSGMLHKLLPYVPGHPNLLHLLKKTKREVANIVRNYGVVLNPNEPIIVSGIQLTPNDAAILDRGREWQELQLQLPKEISTKDWATIQTMLKNAIQIHYQDYTVDGPIDQSRIGQSAVESSIMADQMGGGNTHQPQQTPHTIEIPVHRNAVRDGVPTKVA